MRKVIIVGGGHSVLEGIEMGLWEKIKEEEVWSLNSVFKLMPYLPTVQLWVDVGFYNNEVENLQELHTKGVKMISRDKLTWKALYKEITMYQTTREIKIKQKSDNKELIYYGSMGLVGCFAVGVATQMEYDRIYILGYDYGATSLNNKYTHWYQNKISTLKIHSSGAGRPQVYLDKKGKPNKFLRDWDYYKDKKDVVRNVSINSNLEIFPKITYENMFGDLEKNNARMDEDNGNNDINNDSLGYN